MSDQNCLCLCFQKKTPFSYVGNVDKISLLYEATMVDGKNQSEGELTVSQQVIFINNKPIGRVKYALI